MLRRQLATGAPDARLQRGLEPGSLPRSHGDLLPAPLARDPESSVGACRNRLQLALELAPRAQPIEHKASVVYRRQHCAVGFARVCAVAEPALGGERFDVREGSVEVSLPELELAQPRRVDDECSALQPDELTMRGRV